MCFICKIFDKTSTPLSQNNKHKNIMERSIQLLLDFIYLFFELTPTGMNILEKIQIYLRGKQRDKLLILGIREL
jgi:hypothetical protein